MSLYVPILVLAVLAAVFAIVTAGFAVFSEAP